MRRLDWKDVFFGVLTYVVPVLTIVALAGCCAAYPIRHAECRDHGWRPWCEAWSRAAGCVDEGREDGDAAEWL